MSSVFKWMIVLMLLMAVTAGGGVYLYYIRSDEMLRAEVLKQLSQMAPDLKFSLERASFDLSGLRIRLSGLAVQLPGEIDPALDIPEAVLTLDNQVTEFQQNISIQRIRLVHPRLNSIRRRDGRWNWQDTRFQPTSSPFLPHVEVEHAAVNIELQREHASPVKLTLADLNVTLAPAASRKMTGIVSARIEPAGPFSATVEADIDGPAFSLEAKWLKIPVDDDLLALIGDISPDAEAKLQAARRFVDELAASQAASSPIPEFHRESEQSLNFVGLRTNPDPRIPAARFGFGVKCHSNLHLKLKRQNQGDTFDFEVLAEIREGQISNQLLPFPLHQVNGSLYANSRTMIVRDFHAENGSTRMDLNLRLDDYRIPTGRLQVRNVAIDAPLKARLPDTMRKILHSISIEGVCDGDLIAIQRDGKLVIESDLKIIRGVVSHERFPYPVRDVTGNISFRGNTIEIRGEGSASGVPVTLIGTVINPGPANDSNFVIHAVALPINKTFVDACPATVQRAITDLKLEGEQDIWVRVWKPAGIGQRFTSQTKLVLRGCSCMFKGFPYRISKLQGEVLTNEEVIVFKDLRGQHDATEITASGRFLRLPAPGRLSLVIRAQNGAFDRSLEAAIPQSIHPAWEEFQPIGRFDVETLIDWVPGQPCHVELPQITVYDAEIAMRGFCWPMRAVRGEFSYAAPKLTIRSVSAQHDDTQIRGRGIAWFSPGAPWRVRFNELHVDDLIPNLTLRNALPPQLRKVYESLSPSGKFSIETMRKDRAEPSLFREGWFELSGGREHGTISADWDLQVILADTQLTAGIQMDGIHGRIDLRGKCDGQSSDVDGMLDLDSISVLRQASGRPHQISRVAGPIKVRDGELTAGSKAMTTPTSDHIPQSEQISGEFLDGRVTFNASVNLREEPEYKIGVRMSRGKLESYAQQYMRGQSNLAGIMNGWTFLWGKGASADQVRGRGKLLIEPAALYELPLFVQIFRVLRLDAADRTAFKSAGLAYTIENSRFNFQTIDLIGSTISLRGRGYVRFDGLMQLDFFSMQPRNPVQIPILHEIAGALTRGWVGIKVTGTVGAPNQPQIVPVPELDEAIKQFLGSFDPTPQLPANRNLMPGLRRTN